RELHRRPEGGWEVVTGPRPRPTAYLADRVVLAVPAAPAARLLRPVSPEAADLLGEVESASMAVVTLAYASQELGGLHGSGFLVPPVDGRTVKASTFSAAKWDWVRQAGDHVDLNFGCPVPKVTRKGGGSALPWKTDLFRGIVRSAVREAAPAGIPVTMKMRGGIDDEHETFLDAGRIAEEEGVAAVALHARTAAQAYSGQA